MTDVRTTSLQGYVARDRDGRLSFFQHRKPIRNIHGWWQSPKWRDNGGYRLPESAFPDLTWDSDPIEVEIIVKRKKNE